MPRDAQLQAVLDLLYPFFFFFWTGSVRPHGETQDRNAAQSAPSIYKALCYWGQGRDDGAENNLGFTAAGPKSSLEQPAVYTKLKHVTVNSVYSQMIAGRRFFLVEHVAGGFTIAALRTDMINRRIFA